MNETTGDDGALGAATRWLELIDRGELQEAWRSASPPLTAERRSGSAFAAGTTEHRWCAEVGGIRSRLGRVRSRRLEGVSRHDELGPDERVAGVALRFATRFEQVEGAHETVVVGEDAEGVWRVSGYRIVLGTQASAGRPGRSD